MPTYQQIRETEWKSNSILRDFVERLRSLKDRDKDYSQDGLVDFLVTMIVEKEDECARKMNIQNIVDWDTIVFDTYVYVYWMIMHEYFNGEELLKPNDKEKISNMLRGKSIIKYTTL